MSLPRASLSSYRIVTEQQSALMLPCYMLHDPQQARTAPCHSTTSLKGLDMVSTGAMQARLRHAGGAAQRVLRSGRRGRLL